MGTKKVPFLGEARMRVLWIDADQNPWTERNGWQVLEDFGLQVARMDSVEAAEPFLTGKNYDLLLVRAEVPRSEAFLVRARKLLQTDDRPSGGYSHSRPGKVL